MAKYDTLRKTARDAQLVAYAKGHPNDSLEEIGRVFNISKGRVSQVLCKHDMRRRKNGIHNDQPAKHPQLQGDQ